MGKNASHIRRTQYNLSVLLGGSSRLIIKSPIESLNLAYRDDIRAALYDKPFQYMIKRTLDIVISGLGLLFSLPVIFLFALLIKLDSPGPAFFSQTRVGKGGKPFKIYKLRSMVIDAAEQQEALETHNETQGIIFKIKADPRVTRIGRFIRKYSIDELPQLLNVLKGEMSLVGPRPLPLDNVQKFEKHHFNWFKVPQGITGSWQTQGRSELLDFEEIYRLECDYMVNWSLIKDLKFLIKTVGVVFSGKGAC